MAIILFALATDPPLVISTPCSFQLGGRQPFSWLINARSTTPAAVLARFPHHGDASAWAGRVPGRVRGRDGPVIVLRSGGRWAPPTGSVRPPPPRICQCAQRATCEGWTGESYRTLGSQSQISSKKQNLVSLVKGIY
ncbi:uncharacterized protein Nid2l1 isoform X2 [Rattus norvegicus]|uniref:uncharacterized protein Nid2l1 isoform X2 n=1 Tax=Rattus norvegicus TaxID=10116 RepID=UPI002FD86602